VGRLWVWGAAPLAAQKQPLRCPCAAQPPAAKAPTFFAAQPRPLSTGARAPLPYHQTKPNHPQFDSRPYGCRLCLRLAWAIATGLCLAAAGALRVRDHDGLWYALSLAAGSAYMFGTPQDETASDVSTASTGHTHKHQVGLRDRAGRGAESPARLSGRRGSRPFPCPPARPRPRACPRARLLAQGHGLKPPSPLQSQSNLPASPGHG
jgi:hypothetical protein